MIPTTYNYVWARRDAKLRRSVIQCHCDCHYGWEDNRKSQPRPDAIPGLALCQACVDEANRPWTDVLESLA